VKVYPDTDYVKEFGGEYRLDKFGVVVGRYTYRPAEPSGLQGASVAWT
jgi:hypothetical protein